MPTRETPFETHEVVNQPPPLADYNLYTSDPALREAVAREGGGWAEAALRACGARAGTAESFENGRLANAHPPILQTYDRFGRRCDAVEFHPAWHAVLSRLFEEGVHSSAWAEPRAGGHVVRAAKYLMLAQVECGALCPVTMTFGAVTTIRKVPKLAELWLPKLFSRCYDPRFRPIAEKAAGMIGMGLTEKQGGSDVRANATVARPLAESGDEYELIGHKWFLSAPMCDAFLITAQAPGGITCFFMPRWRPDGSLNGIRIRRLKDKLGNRSNATSEVEFERAWAIRVGEEGRGIPTAIEMANHTRLDCVLGTTGILRQAVAQAVFHAAHRSAFQRRLVDQPLMRNVLADLAVETEAAVALALRLARTAESAEAGETVLHRLLTPAAKYWICKRGPTLAAEAMEVIGGNGYVEDSILARIYREMPVNSIWEGSGNVMCLDVLRVLAKSPAAVEAFRAELAPARGLDAHFDRFVAAWERALADPAEPETRARHLTEQLILALQGALLLRHGPAAVAAAFCASRLGGDGGRTIGTLPAGLDFKTIIDRATVDPEIPTVPELRSVAGGGADGGR